MNNGITLDRTQPLKNTEPDHGLRYLWFSDLYRHTGKGGFISYYKALWRNPGYRYSFFLRLCSYLRKEKSNILKRILYRLAYEVLRQIGIRFGIVIHPEIEIGEGLYIVNFGGIFINAQTKIGRNCNISQGVVIGPTNRGEKKGCPEIGDNVFIGPGALVVGKIQIGDNVAIGGNAVVNQDVPANSVVVGNPGRIISSQGSVSYVNRVDYARYWHVNRLCPLNPS